jgi:hypothetical protein
MVVGSSVVPWSARLAEAVHQVLTGLVEGDEVNTFTSEMVVPLPPGWAARDSATFTAPDGLSNLIVSSEPLDRTPTAREYADGPLSDLQGLNEFEELSFERVELPGGVEGYVRRYTWINDDVPISQFLAHFVVGDRGYTASGTSLKGVPETEAQLLQLVQAIAVQPSQPRAT